MLTNKSYSQLACEFSEIVYERFLEKVYGVNACSNKAMYFHDDDYKLQLLIKQTGFKSALELKKMGVELQVLKEAAGVGNFYTIQNNTYVNNTYNTTNYSSTGYVHNQASVSTTWNITHGLPFCPNVTILDTSGQRISGQINYSSDCATVTITFNTPLAGKAYLS